jgi:serine/threonine protein kinase
LPPARATAYLKTIAEAVHFAHQRGTLHRDLKPQNVLIDRDDRPRITDFGLAKRVGSDSHLTQSGAVLGSPSYMPPEQALGRHDQVGPHSDVYSLGTILYALLTGRPPFHAATAMDGHVAAGDR